MKLVHLENDLKKIIGNLWYVRDDFRKIVQNKLLLRRASLIQDIVGIVSEYNPQKDDFPDRLILDNYVGSIQHYLTGYDLSSIHLSSKSLEVAFLFKIRSPNVNEKIGSFGDLCSISIRRGLIKQRETVGQAWNVVNRRNMTMHDAILEQALLSVSEEWIQAKLSTMSYIHRRVAENMLKPLLSMLRRRLLMFDSIPDLGWYVMDKSFESTKNLMVDFLERGISNLALPVFSIEGKDAKAYLSKLQKIPQVIRDVKQAMLYESDFIEYSARQNIQDVKDVLIELYGAELFTF